MATIKPQHVKDSDWSDMKDQLKKVFFDLIYKPMLDLLLPYSAQVKIAAKEIKNAATSAIVAAIKSGKIQLTDGTFSGDFNATLSKELRKMGATWNKVTKTFHLAPNKVPPDVAAMAFEYNQTAELLHKELDKRLAEIEAGLKSGTVDIPLDATDTVERVQAGFKKATVEVLGDANSDLSDEGKKRLSKEYEDNLRPYVSDFSQDQIAQLRELIAENARHNYRFDRLTDIIQNKFGVSHTKAEFLARQETSMLVSKHRQVRFEDVGVTRYIWRSTHDSRVRDRHKSLDGREFSYANPPVVDVATNRRANPGQDFNCRCVDEPILPSVEAFS